MKNLINAVIKAEQQHVKDCIMRFDLEPEDDWWPQSMRAKYKGTPDQVRAKVIKMLEREAAARIKEKLAKIAATAPMDYDRLPNPVIARIDWTRSRTWGYTAKASDNYGNVSGVASGCGYDKASAALADVLNANPYILRRLYAAADKAIAAENTGSVPGVGGEYVKAIGYGAGYSVLPYFEGGVGVSCHVRILEGLGYSVTWSGDVIVIGEK